MSKLHRISIHTLRYYDEIDLFKPIYVDKESNYRYYSIDQFSQLDIIKYLKYLGTPLKEIKSELEENNEETLNLLNNKIDIVNEKIKELELIKKVLTWKKETIESRNKIDNIGKQLESISVFYGGVSGLTLMDEVIENKKVIYKNSFIYVERELFNDEGLLTEIQIQVKRRSNRFGQKRKMFIFKQIICKE